MGFSGWSPEAVQFFKGLQADNTKAYTATHSLPGRRERRRSPRRRPARLVILGADDQVTALARKPSATLTGQPPVATRGVAADPPGMPRGDRRLPVPAPAAIIAAARTLPVMELRPGLKDVRRPAELMYAYIVLSLLVGLRTEEARALRLDHVDLDGDPDAAPAVPPHVAVWRSVRVHGETKTERSRRTLGLPRLAVDALRELLQVQAQERAHAGDQWQDTGLVFATRHGDALDPANVRKMFRRVYLAAGVGDVWTPRELRTSFVSLMSSNGVSTEEIARLVGHSSTRTTEVVYRRELRPVITTGAEIMDKVFKAS